MSAVQLTRVWLTDPADPSVSVVAGSAPRTDNRALAGEVRQYAGGRRRIVLREGDSTTLGVTLIKVSAGDLEQLDAWRGQVLLLRDRVGRRVHGTYFGLDVTDHPGQPVEHDVSFTFASVSYDEAV